jgi:hypothetical protein
MRRLPGWSADVLVALAACQGPACLAHEPKVVLPTEPLSLRCLAVASSPDGRTLAAGRSQQAPMGRHSATSTEATI